MNDSYLNKYQKIAGDDNVDITLDPPVFFPDSKKVLCEIVRSIHSDKQKIRIIGKGTLPVPESSSDVILLSTAALSTVKEINADDYLIKVQAGVIVDNAVEMAEQYGLYVPLDITSGNISTIGGAYMTDAHGPAAAGYGAFGESVIGITCVNARGEIMNFGGRTVKNVTGYDVTRFLSGTLGLFAIAAELVIKANPMPESRLMAVAKFQSILSVSEMLNSLRSDFHDAMRLELTALDGTGGEITLGVGFEGFSDAVKKKVNDVRNLMNNAGAEEIHSQHFEPYMKMRRKAAEKIVVPGLHTISIPPTSAGVFLKKIQSISPEMPIIAHIKTGRIHIVSSNKEHLALLKEYSRAIGGKLPRAWDYLQSKKLKSVLSDAEMSVVKSLKEDMDPRVIFNPHLRSW